YLMPEAGPGTSYHYIGAEAKVADGGWETLGDVGYVDEDGYLYLGGRRSDMNNTGGANIYPAEVEWTLAEHPGVDTVVAIGLPDEDMGELVHAIVQPHDDWNDKLDDAMLAEFVEERLARYKTPRSYEFVTYSLRNDAGKVRRSQLRAERIPTKA
ncbi:MAG TPA: acid--CoA ligase, partial [Alphaproteobacteria bacterium]|nr:acid--CoA ligase [Alphaproteobacteria bacterium]